MYICAILLFLLGFRIEGSHETTVGYGDTLFLDDHQPYEITADFVLKGSVVGPSVVTLKNGAHLSIYPNASWTKDNSSLITGFINISTLSIQDAGSTLTFIDSFQQQQYQSTLYVDTLFVGSGAYILAQGQGYHGAGKLVFASSEASAQGSPNTGDGGFHAGVGGGSGDIENGCYGGYVIKEVALMNGNATTNITDCSSTSRAAYFGNAFRPASSGAAGGSSSVSSGSRGGGVIRIIATQNVTINGELSASGASCSVGTAAGGGAGGSIWITTYNEINGAGKISAHGGDGCIDVSNGSGGGSGGRIAIHSNEEKNEFQGIFSLHAGKSDMRMLREGAGGSLYVSSTAEGFGGTLLVHGGGEVKIKCDSNDTEVNFTLGAIHLRDDTSISIESGCEGLNVDAIIRSVSVVSDNELDISSLTPSRRLISDVQRQDLTKCKYQLGAPWPSLGRNCHHTNAAPFRTSQTDFAQKWSFFPARYSWDYYLSTLPGNYFNLTLIAHDRLHQPVIDKLSVLYYTAAIYVIAMDAITGKIHWVYPLNSRVYGSVAIGVDGTLYVVSCDYHSSSSHDLYALNPDGTLKWSLGSLGGSRGSPTIGYDNTLFITSFETCCIHAVEDQTTQGVIKWSKCEGTWPDNCVLGGSYSSPALALATSPVLVNKTANHTQTTPSFVGTIIYSGSNTGVFSALEESDDRTFAKILWTYNTTSSIDSTASIDTENEILFFGNNDGVFYAFNLTSAITNDTKVPLWTYTEGGSVGRSMPSFDGQNVYIGTADKKIYAINKLSGQKIWSFTSTDGNFENSAAVIGGDGSLYIGSNKDSSGYSSLYTLDPLTGSNVNSPIQFNTGHVGSLALGAEGSIYFSTSSGTIYRYGESKSCSGGRAINLDFGSTDVSFEESICPARFQPDGGTCRYCGSSDCPLQATKNLTIESSLSGALTNTTFPKFTVQSQSSIILHSNLTLSNFNLILKSNSQLYFLHDIFVGDNSTLRVSYESYLADKERLDDLQNRANVSIACRDISVQTDGVIKLDDVNETSTFGIEVTNIYLNGKIDGENISECLTTTPSLPASKKQWNAFLELQSYCQDDVNIWPGDGHHGANLKIISTHTFELNGLISLQGYEGRNGGSFEGDLSTFIGSGSILVNGGNGSKYVFVNDNQFGTPGLAGNVSISTSSTDNFTGSFVALSGSAYVVV